ncbi:MAG: trigger factor [Methylococcales bacterium]|nr:trigger factor [Methylococcales bacterium]
MQVSVEQTSELSRTMTVSIPEEVIQEKVDVRLKSLKNEVRIDGFRPGKVPKGLIKKRYSSRVRGEIAGDIIQSSYYEALQQESLTPVDMPTIKPIVQETGLAYTAEFEVYPTISLEGLTEIEAKRPISSISDADFDEMLLKLRKHKVVWAIVERAAQDQDRVTVNFTGTCEDESFTDGTVENFEVEIGSNSMIPGFEAALLSLETGNHKQVELTFPTEYTAKPELAGKLASFEVDVVKIEAPQLPEINEDFVQEYGIDSGDIDAFYTDVKANMENELKKALTGVLKTSVLSAVYTNTEITLPNALVQREIKEIMGPYVENLKKQNIALEDLNLPKDVFEEEAKRRIGLGLILSEIIEQNELVVSSENLRKEVTNLAKSYDSPDEVLAWYYEDQSRLDEVKQRLLEEQTVQWLTGKIVLTDELYKFNDLVNKFHQQSQQRG